MHFLLIDNSLLRSDLIQIVDGASDDENHVHWSLFFNLLCVFSSDVIFDVLRMASHLEESLDIFKILLSEVLGMEVVDGSSVFGL